MGSADFRATVDEAANLLEAESCPCGDAGCTARLDIASCLRSGLADHERAVKEECAGTAANILAVYRRHFSDPRLAEECRSEIVRALRTPPPSPEPVVPPEPPVPVLGTPNNQGPYPAAADTTLGTCCGALVPFVITGHVVPFSCTRPPNHARDYHVAHGEGLCGYVRIAPTPPPSPEPVTAATEAGTWQERHRIACEKFEPPDHAWFRFRLDDSCDCCARCGIVRPRDESKLKPCRGTVGVELRSPDRNPDEPVPAPINAAFDLARRSPPPPDATEAGTCGARCTDHGTEHVCSRPAGHDPAIGHTDGHGQWGDESCDTPSAPRPPPDAGGRRDCTTCARSRVRPDKEPCLSCSNGDEFPAWTPRECRAKEG